MRSAILLLIASATLCAQSVTVSIHDPSGAAPDIPISSTYQFSNTPVGSGSSIDLRLTNSAGSAVEIISVLVGSAAGSTAPSANYTVTGQTVDKILSTSSSSFEDVTVSFVPESQGLLMGYLQVVYQVEQNGCQFQTAGATACGTQTLSASTLLGSATAPSLVLSYTGTSGLTALQPFSATPLNFGNVSTSATAAMTFTITNESTGTLSTPAVTLLSQIGNSSAFALNTSTLPSTLAAGASGTFTVTFAPGQTGLTTATLTMGSLTYPLEGTGIVVADIDALQISYANSSGVRIEPQAATPISFGQVVSGTSGSNILSFTVTNPSTSWNAVTLSTLSVSGAAFTMTNAPSAPVSIAPGTAITFSLSFASSTQGAYAGTLAIGTRVFSLAGSSISSGLPSFTLQVDSEPLTSAMQAHLSVQFASASTVSAIGQLTMTFKPSVANVTNDSAIEFTATSGRNLQVNVAVGGQTATYEGESEFTFQTGTTAGTITFTLTFPNQAPVTKSFTIAPAQIQISELTAKRQSPNLVMTLTAFDNTYTAGKLIFTFFDVNGNSLTSTPITIDASSAFAQYFAESTVGGAFSIQASFPVTGDVTKVGSVTIQMPNSIGTASATENFQ